MNTQHVFNCVEMVRKEVNKSLPAQQFSIFLLVGLNPGITQTEIAETLEMPQGTVSRNVARVEEFGLVVTRPDTNIDTRRVAVWPTKRGEGLLGKIDSL